MKFLSSESKLPLTPLFTPQIFTLTLCRFAVLAPFLVLAFFVLNLGVNSVNVPYIDDWRVFNEGRAGSLSFEYLFEGVNGTVSPIGKALDSFVVRYLSSNNSVYQVLSAVLTLGSILLLQLLLLQKLISNRAIVSFAFLTSILLFHTLSYWSGPSLGYHQAIPVVCVFGILLLSLQDQNRIRLISIAGLTLIAGLSYISGAFAALALSIAFITQRYLFPKSDQKYQLIGCVIFIAALGPVLVQLNYLLISDDPGSNISGTITWRSLLDREFWEFSLGLVGSALALPTETALLSFIATLVFVFCSLAAIGNLALTVSREDSETRLADFMAIIWGLLLIVSTYVAIIALARYWYRPNGITDTFLSVFVFAFNRFHYFWISAIIPFSVAAVLIVVEKHLARLKVPIFIPALLTAGLVIGPGLLDDKNFGFNEKFLRANYAKRNILRCLTEHQFESADTLPCRDPFTNPTGRGYLEAILVDATFMRSIDVDKRVKAVEQSGVGLSAERGAKISKNIGLKTGKIIRVENSIVHKNVGHHLNLTTGVDPQIFIKLNPETLSGCQTLSFDITQRVFEPNVLQIFYKSGSSTRFSETKSVKLHLKPGVNRLKPVVTSDAGFNAVIRIDPVRSMQDVDIKKLKVTCN